jgi:hypothetical protein
MAANITTLQVLSLNHRDSRVTEEHYNFSTNLSAAKNMPSSPIPIGTDEPITC